MTHLLGGLVLGIVIMVGPALLLNLFSFAGRVYVTGESLPARFDGALMAASPLEVVIEVVWLVLPALIIILALYWLAIRRTRWAGYDEAVKWSRR
jgi:hypothetical protein